MALYCTLISWDIPDQICVQTGMDTSNRFYCYAYFYPTNCEIYHHPYDVRMWNWFKWPEMGFTPRLLSPQEQNFRSVIVDGLSNSQLPKSVSECNVLEIGRNNSTLWNDWYMRKIYCWKDQTICIVMLNILAYKFYDFLLFVCVCVCVCLCVCVCVCGWVCGDGWMKPPCRKAKVQGMQPHMW